MASSNISRGPCCETNKLIVQITGKDHSLTQRLAVYDQAGNRLDALTDEDQPENFKTPSLIGSTLHVWDWTCNYKHRLWLEIDTLDASGRNVMRLPLPEVGITPRQFDAQWNQIVPIIPFTALPGANSAYDHGTPVLCRAGFIYVFLDGRLWRELEVRVEDDNTTYHDVDLNRYRFANHIDPGARPATGVALDDIWLPASWNNQRVSPQLCFSEVQLSGPRLQRLEQDPQLREQRCQSPDLRCSRDKYKSIFRDKPDGAAMLDAFSTFNAFDYPNQTAAAAAHTSWLNLNSHAFPVSIVAPQRARQPGYEWLLDQPARYLCDLSGQFPAIALTEARQHVMRCEKGEVAYQPSNVETGAWAHWQQQICDASAELAIELWQEQPAVSDVLERARKRELYGVLLHDSHYRLRHLQTRIHDQQQLLTLCATRASLQPHHASALLVQQLIVPRALRGEPNPLHRKLDKLDEHGKRDLNRLTASGERTQLWRQLEMTQSLLTTQLQQHHTEQTLTDHLSLDGFDYVAAMHFVSRLFASLATTPAQIDPLAVSGDVPNALTGETLYSPKASVGQQLISRVANDEGHGLHRMLWPDLESQDLEVAYVKPKVMEPNQGDGKFRSTELYHTACTPAPDIEQINTLDAMLLLGMLESGDFKNTLTGMLKAVAATTISFHENLQGAVNVAEQALHAANHIPVPAAGTERKVGTLKRALQRQAVAQLRSLLPEVFGDAHFITLQEAINRNLYVFGFSDMPQASHHKTHAYRDYKNPSGRSIVDREHYQTGGDLHANTLVIAMPRDHAFVKLISEANQRINTAWQEELAEQKAAKNSAIQNAVASRDALQNGKVYRALNSTPFAVAVVMLELVNLGNELEARIAAEREKGSARAIGGISAAGIDLLIAMEALTVKLAGGESVLTAGRKTLFTISAPLAERVLGPLSKYFLKEFTGRLLGQMVAGALFVGLNLYDAWQAYQWGDNAMWGHLLMAAGGLSGIASSLMVGGAAFLGLGPAGWVSFILISVGAGLVYWLSSKPIEDWLSTGPFAPFSDRMQDLQDSKQAFYYLVSLFADIRISIGFNPEYEDRPTIVSWNPVPFYVREANTRILVESNLPGLVGAELQTQIEWRLQETQTEHNWRGDPTHQRKRLIQKESLAYRTLPNGREIFITTPPNQSADGFSRPSYSYKWLVRAQLLWQEGDRTWVFPAPPPKDPTLFSPDYAKPDFENTQLFWADEISHETRSGK